MRDVCGVKLELGEASSRYGVLGLFVFSFGVSAECVGMGSRGEGEYGDVVRGVRCGGCLG